MAKYVCSICGYVYDESKGIPEKGIAPRTAFEDLPDDWSCPLCGAPKSEFEKQTEAPLSALAPAVEKNKANGAMPDTHSDMKKLSAPEMHALCINLARGCEKQYKSDEAVLFKELADYFKTKAPALENSDYDKLYGLIEKNIEEDFPNAKAVSGDDKDRGALRALTWSEKVTRIQKSLIERYKKEGDAMVENTGVYVCTICGFIYIGDTPPEICPVCKVPNWKFEKIEGR